MVSTAEVIRRRRAWAESILARAKGRVPVYGSLEWCQLPDGPEKTAAVVQAAEARVREHETACSDVTKLSRDRAFVEAGDKHQDYWAGAAEAIARRRSA